MLAIIAFVRPRHDAPPPAITVPTADVVSARVDGRVLPPTTPAFAAAARLPAMLLRAVPLAAPVAWSTPRTLDLTLRDGTRVWLQLMPGGLARMTADGAPTSDGRRLAALRAGRRQAYRLQAGQVGEIMGKSGVPDGQQAYPQERKGDGRAGASHR